MNTNEELWARALQLPEDERAALAHDLLLSLEPESEDPGRNEAWNLELEKRLAEVAAGTYTAREAREVIAEIERSIDERRSS